MLSCFLVERGIFSFTLNVSKSEIGKGAIVRRKFQTSKKQMFILTSVKEMKEKFSNMKNI
jgi:hypothetical protein